MGLVDLLTSISFLGWCLFLFAVFGLYFNLTCINKFKVKLFNQQIQNKFKHLCHLFILVINLIVFIGLFIMLIAGVDGLMTNQFLELKNKKYNQFKCNIYSSNYDFAYQPNFYCGKYDLSSITMVILFKNIIIFEQLDNYTRSHKKHYYIYYLDNNLLFPISLEKARWLKNKYKSKTIYITSDKG